MEQQLLSQQFDGMRILLALVFVIVTQCANGQHVPYGLRENNVQRELASKTKDIDSLVLIDKASFWDEDMKIFGLAFKHNDVYKLTITFKPGKTSFYDMKVKDIKKIKISEELVIGSIRKMKIFSATTLNLDSLNQKAAWTISDQHEWTMLFIKNMEITIKQSYAPEVYQPLLPTKDRKLFMDLFNQINTLNN